MELIDVFKAVRSNIVTINDTNTLVELGIDSFDTMKLIFEIEDVYGIVISDEEINPDNFATVLGIKNLLRKHGVKFK